MVNAMLMKLRFYPVITLVRRLIDRVSDLFHIF